MPLPPCRPLLPAVLATHCRRGPLCDLSCAYRRRGLQLNLNWAVSLLAAIPGTHQQRISPASVTHGRGSQPPSWSHRSAALESQQQHGSRAGVSKEELGRATWTLLHMLAAQWPQQPSRQQQKDLISLIDVLTRIYPCADCAAHFKEVVRRTPPRAKTQQDLEQWMCEAHNAVNQRLGKPLFNCRMAGLRWLGLDCDAQEACALSGGAS